MNCARSVFPSIFCVLASARSSKYVLIPLETAISEMSNMVKRGGRFRFLEDDLVAELSSPDSWPSISCSCSLSAAIASLAAVVAGGGVF